MNYRVSSGRTTFTSQRLCISDQFLQFIVSLFEISREVQCFRQPCVRNKASSL